MTISHSLGTATLRLQRSYKVNAVKPAILEFSTSLKIIIEKGLVLELLLTQKQTGTRSGFEVGYHGRHCDKLVVQMRTGTIAGSQTLHYYKVYIFYNSIIHY